MVSNLKAELVRNNIVTRNDLVKLYQPPLKRAMVPSENPFFTRQMVNRPLVSQQHTNRNRYNILDKDEIAKSIGYQNLFGKNDYSAPYHSNVTTISERGRLSHTSQGARRKPQTSLQGLRFRNRGGSTRDSTLHSSGIGGRPYRPTAEEIDQRLQLLKSQ